MRFQRPAETRADLAYGDFKRNMAVKDGNKHVVVLQNFGKLGNQHFSIEQKITREVDAFLTCMQEDGYEVISVEHQTLSSGGAFGVRRAFTTMITYR